MERGTVWQNEDCETGQVILQELIQKGKIWTLREDSISTLRAGLIHHEWQSCGIPPNEALTHIHRLFRTKKTAGDLKHLVAARPTEELLTLFTKTFDSKKKEEVDKEQLGQAQEVSTKSKIRTPAVEKFRAQLRDDIRVMNSDINSEETCVGKFHVCIWNEALGDANRHFKMNVEVLGRHWNFSRREVICPGVPWNVDWFKKRFSKELKNAKQIPKREYHRWANIPAAKARIQQQRKEQEQISNGKKVDDGSEGLVSSSPSK